MVAACAPLGCPGPARTIVYDLARRTSVAERWSARDVILFGTPAAEPAQVDGFYREASPLDAGSFLWTKEEAEVSLSWPQPAPRAAIVDLEPYSRVRAQAVEVRLNGTAVDRFNLNDQRARYRIALPVAAQRAGDNRVRFVFAKAASPADTDPRNADKRHLAAAFHSLVIGAADDAGLDDLLGRDAPRPFDVVETTNGLPSLVVVGPAVVRYALRLPAGAELRVSPDLLPSARAAAGAAALRVTIEAQPGQERELWSRTIGARDKAPGEIVLRLPGAAGDIVRLGLWVGASGGDRFAWATWGAPRILGQGASDPFAPVPLASEDEARAAPLRAKLAGSNVVLIVLDAARSREFGCYGYSRATTPEIDRIAREGVAFDGVFTPAVYTLAAMSSVWTSQHPDRHHSEVSFSARLPASRLTLAELLGARGIPSAGFVANAVAGKAFGFDRGFSDFYETFRDPEFGSGARAIAKFAPQWLAAHKDAPFFAYVHFREPHFPYDPPPPFDTRFGPDGPIPKALRGDQAYFTDVNQGRRPMTAVERDHLVRLYDGNLAHADEQVGVLRHTLEGLGLWEKTVVVVMADHGEGLGEHGWIGHNVQVYDESAHVPLVIRFPEGKGPAGARVSGLADLLDVAPTIADVFGALGDATRGRFEGHSLLPMVEGGPGKGAVLSRTVWDRPIYALRDGTHELVYDTRTGEQRLYVCASDPGEARDVKAVEPLRAAYYREALHLWIARLGARAAGHEQAAPTREQCENLKAMGYLPSDFKCPDR